MLCHVRCVCMLNLRVLIETPLKLIPIKLGWAQT